MSSPLELQIRAHQLTRALVAASGRHGWMIDALRAELARRGAHALGGQAWPWSPGELAYSLRSELQHALQPRGSAELPPGSVLFAPRHRGVDLLPVARALAASGVPVALARTPHDVAAWDPALPHVELAALAPRTVGARAALHTARAIRRLRGLPALPGFAAGEQERCARAQARVLALNLPMVLRLAGAAERLFSSSRPRVLVVGNHYTLEGRTLALTARRLGIPVATCEHGSIFPGDPSWHDVPCDLVCTWGQVSRELVQRATGGQVQVAVTGAPKLDALLEAARALPTPADPLVLVATSGPGDKVSLAEHLAFLEILFAAAQALPGIRFHAKLHRKDREAFYQQQATRTPAPNLSWKAADGTVFGGDIYAALRGARALVTIQSTSAIDAMLMGVPVIVVDVNGRGRQGDAPFLAHTRKAVSAAELVRAVQAAAAPDPSDAGARAYVAQHFAHLGQAAGTTAQAILGLAAVSQSPPA